MNTNDHAGENSHQPWSREARANVFIFMGYMSMLLGLLSLSYSHKIKSAQAALSTDFAVLGTLSFTIGIAAMAGAVFLYHTPSTPKPNIEPTDPTQKKSTPNNVFPITMAIKKRTV